MEKLEEVKRSFYILKDPSREYSKQAGVIATLNEALVVKRKLSVRYKGPGWTAPKNYMLAPYAILLFKHALYVAAQDDEHPDQIRFFSVKRIVAASITRKVFKVPRDFKLDEYMKDAFGIMVEKPRTVRIWFDGRIAPIIEETVWHPSQKIKRDEDGSLVLSLRVGGLEEVLWWVLSYGANAKILEPPELVEQMKKTLHEMQGRYL